MVAQTNNFIQVFKILRRSVAGRSIKTSLAKHREGHIINNESGCISRRFFANGHIQYNVFLLADRNSTA